MLRADRVVKARGRDGVRDHTARGGESRAPPEAAVIEGEDVATGVEEMRNEVGHRGQVARVSVTEKDGSDGIHCAAIPAVQQLTVRCLHPLLGYARFRDAVV